MMKPGLLQATLLIALCGAAADAHAQTVNKWVDEDGVTHFSDQKPPDNDTEVREIEIPRGSVSEFESQEVNQRLNRVLQQMEQDRKAREREAETAKKAREADRAPEREPITEEKKKKKDHDRSYDGPYPKPLPGPFPEQYPRQRGPVDSSGTALPGGNQK